MKKIRLGTSDQLVSSVILGCMRLNGSEQPEKVIETAFENGINFFDHADIYGGGDCETIFCSSVSKNFAKT